MRSQRVFWACLLSVLSGFGTRADDQLQSRVNKLMRERRGAVLVSNPQTGEILAEWNHELAFGRVFPPGSTAKVVACAVALEEGLIAADHRVFCRGVPELLGKPFRCSHPPALEPYTVISALANSCNYFFVALSDRLRADSLTHGYAQFGFGDVMEAGNADVSVGTVSVSDSPAAKARAVLGESPAVVTPAQLLSVYSTVATRGAAYRLRRPSASKGPPAIQRRIKLQAATWKTLVQGLEECVRSGTGQAAAVEGVRVAGKTGTATVNRGGASHAWFVGFAPVDSPEVALVVFLVRGTGARDAAPLAGRILGHYFALKSRRR